MYKRLWTLALACVCFGMALGQQGPVKVEVKKEGDRYTLLRGGKPYFIRGAGGTGKYARLAAYGGNSMRTWSTRDAQKILDSAQANGLTVLMGLDVARERHGFDYDNTAAVKAQLEKIRAEVNKYKNHPALLAWGIGNELNLHYSNPKVWNAVNDISEMIHREDPNHPTSTMLAGLNPGLVAEMKQRCPDIDILSVNMYGDLPQLPAKIKESGWEGPYMVTEWGPTGHWEGRLTEWKMPIEETSSEKANVYKMRYEYSVETDRKNCLGSYVFLWGQKQERTPTWYGLFTEKGEESEVLDVMQFLWTGQWPEHLAPHIYSLQLNGKTPIQQVYLQPGETAPVVAFAIHPGKEKLSYRWELLPEPTEVGDGGDYEARPKAIPGMLTDEGKGQARLRVPEKEGAYRVFVYVVDENNKVATANLPFYVKKENAE